MLGNALDLPQCEYLSAADIRDALANELGESASTTRYTGRFRPSTAPADVDVAALDVPIYAVDAVVRRGPALQRTAAAGERRAIDADGVVRA